MAGEAARGLACAERAALCDLLTEVGPEEPTLCAGWTTRDLAVHLVVRERRPWRWGGAAVRRQAEQMAFEELVAALRQPPRWSLGGFGWVDRLANTAELFIHHEDVRRARPQWQVRPLTRAQQAELWRAVRLLAKLGLLRFRASVVVEAPGFGRVTAGRGGAGVRVVGPPSELALFVTGRQRAARQVRVIGPDALAEQLASAELGW